MGAGAPGVDDPLGDALVVEVHDLLAQVVVLQEGGAAGADPEGVVGVVDDGAGGGGEASPSWAHVGVRASSRTGLPTVRATPTSGLERGFSGLGTLAMALGEAGAEVLAAALGAVAAAGVFAAAALAAALASA